MPDIANYAESIKLILGEGAKYFVVLLFAVLAIRFWRSLQSVTAGNKSKALVLACLATATAGIVGYVSLRHSLSRMYSAYGMRAFQAGNLDPAFGLFQNAVKFWRNADDIGREGVCLIMAGHPEAGRHLLAEARALRDGRSTPFEDFHSGLICFLSGQPDEAVPLLESASRDPVYQWRVTKLLCLITLDENDVTNTARLMQPFAAAPIQEQDHAYIIACLRLAEGQTNEARMLLDKFDTTNAPPGWRSRFDALRKKIWD